MDKKRMKMNSIIIIQQSIKETNVSLAIWLSKEREIRKSVRETSWR